MRTRGKSKLQIKKSIESESEKEDSSINRPNIYPRLQPKREEWSEQRLTTAYIPPRLIGREEERQEIYTFLRNCMLNRMNCKVLYISGVPGVGKTASTLQILRQFQQQVQGEVTCHYINSLTLKNVKDIYRIIYGFLIGNKKLASGYYGDEITKYLATIKKHHVLVIDEIDFLMTRDEKIFYNLFEWTSQITTKLTMIVIANTMDFPERLSQRVASRMGNNRIVFKPYSHEQIKDVIDDRLKHCPMFTNDAVKYASKKLSGYSSDIRTILDVLRNAVRVHKEENRKGQIGIGDIVKIWEEKVARRFELEQLAPLHLEIVSYIKSHGGECISRRLYEVLQQNGMTQGNLEILLKQLQEMGLLRMRETTHKGFCTQSIKLSPSLLL